jgi:hypothetical protein
MYPVSYAFVMLVTCFRVYRSSDPTHKVLGYRIHHFIISGLCICLTALLLLLRDTERSEGVMASDADLDCNCTSNSFKESSLI